MLELKLCTGNRNLCLNVILRMSQSDQNFITKDIVSMIIKSVALWISDQIADDDLLLWTEIKNTVH